MSDRLALALALEEAGMERSNAEGVATAIARFVEGNTATRADVQAAEAALRANIAELRGEMRSGFAQQDTRIERIDGGLRLLRERLEGIENRITLRFGGILAAGLAILFAALHAWPSH